MKRIVLMLFAASLLLYVGCGGEEEADISLTLTNPQGLAVPFNGYYILSTAPDTIDMVGYTDAEYNFTLASGESAHGMVYKDTIDVVDTLHFQAFVNGEEELSVKATTLLEVIQFQVSAQ